MVRINFVIRILQCSCKSQSRYAKVYVLVPYKINLLKDKQISYPSNQKWEVRNAGRKLCITSPCEQSTQRLHPGAPLMNKPFALRATEETLSQAITGLSSKDKLGSVIPLLSLSLLSFCVSLPLHPGQEVTLVPQLLLCLSFVPASTHVLPFPKSAIALAGSESHGNKVVYQLQLIGWGWGQCWAS